MEVKRLGLRFGVKGPGIGVQEIGTTKTVNVRRDYSGSAL